MWVSWEQIKTTLARYRLTTGKTGTMTYSQKLKDPRWQKKRLLVFQRDGFACRDCGNSHNHLQVHHCAYHGNPWDIDDTLLLTVCEDCHEKRQYLEDRAREALGLIFAHSNQAEVESIADHLAIKAHIVTEPERLSLEPHGWLEEERWTHYAEQYPPARSFVEMVLGKIIKWRKSA